MNEYYYMTKNIMPKRTPPVQEPKLFRISCIDRSWIDPYKIGKKENSSKKNLFIKIKLSFQQSALCVTSYRF